MSAPRIIGYTLAGLVLTATYLWHVQWAPLTLLQANSLFCY